jgi:hypothetical protein
MGGEILVHKSIVILANSRRHGGHCIAGKDITTGEWVRPITSFGKGRSDPDAFSDDDLRRLTGDASGPRLLDCVKMGFGSTCGTNCQPENCFIDGKPWKKYSQLPSARLSDLIDRDENCFLGKDDPHNDRIPVAEVKDTPLKNSLNLIKLNRVKNQVTMDHTPKSDGTFKHKMSFTYDTKPYRISVTDSYYEKVYQETKIDDSVVFDDFFMVLGVGSDEFSGTFVPIPQHFRLIVGIIPSYDLKEYSLR